MAALVMKSWSLVLPEHLYAELKGWLFRADGDEHGAVLLAGMTRTKNGIRLLGRKLIRAQDGTDYVPGQRGYRMLTANFVRDAIWAARDEGLVYLAVHNHGGQDSVGFSRDDLESHERGYPALLDIARGKPVGALVFAKNAIAGDIWLTKDQRVELTHTRVVGRVVRDIYPSPRTREHVRRAEFDRQVRAFGSEGQAFLGSLKVGVIGLGGVGSILVEYLARLGVGNLVLVDPERIEPSNYSRILGSRPLDVLMGLPWRDVPWVSRVARRLMPSKARIASRAARRANPRVNVVSICGTLVDDSVARQLTDCDFVFLAADTAQARLVFNCIVHQYLVPGYQLGSKIPADKESGLLGKIHCVARPVTPSSGCLLCNGLINPMRLQEEALDPAERERRRYVDDPEVIAPSVISLNALAASYAVNDFLFRAMGLRQGDEDYVYFEPQKAEVRLEIPRKDGECIHCGLGDRSHLARGDDLSMPTRPR